MDKQPSVKVVYWDIETSLQPVAVFQLANNDWIDPSAILQERYVICASWQVEGESKMRTVSVLDDPERYKKNPHDDYHVIKTLHAMLSDVDVLIHHNGDSFDLRYVETRCLVHGFDPLPPITTIDTYKVAKSRFMLNSNKLDYIARLLKIGAKKGTAPGLWIRVLNGERQAVVEMLDYNKHDVALLKKVFNKLRPYVNNHINRQLLDGNNGCPRCGSHKVQSRGSHRAIARTYRRWQCQSCRGWFRTQKADSDSTTAYRVI